MWLMLQHDEPENYVIATGEAHNVRELVHVAFEHVWLDPERHMRIDPRFIRSAGVEHLVGDYSKAREKLGWAPRTTFERMIS
jgi:GDPmannose 4,6-dehydratase